MVIFAPHKTRSTACEYVGVSSKLALVKQATQCQAHAMETDPKKLREIILNQPTVSFAEKVRETKAVLEADATWRSPELLQPVLEPRRLSH